MAGIADLMRTRRVECDLNEAESPGLTAVKSVIFDLNLSMDEIAEIVAVEWNLSLRVMDVGDLFGSQASCFLCLDPDDLGWAGEGVGNAETSDDCLLFQEVYAWWHSLVGTQEGGQYMSKGALFHFPPGIYTGINPGWGIGRGGGAELSAESAAVLYYRVIKPSNNDLALIVSRRR